MRVYSAAEAIGPAWEHTKALLWRDRNPRRLLKICLVALIAELGGLNGGGFSRNLGRNSSTLPEGALAAIAAAGIVIGLIFFVVGLVLFYLSSRMQFVLLDIVLLQSDRVSPSWQRHGHHTWRWIGVKLLLTLAMVVMLLPLALPAVLAIVRMAQDNGSFGKHSLMLAISSVFGLVAAAVTLLFLLLLVYRYVADVVLPTLALEDLAFGALFERAWLLFSAEPGQMLLYAFLRTIAMVVLGVLCGMAAFAAVLVALLPASAIFGTLWLVLRHAGTAGWAVLGLVGGVMLLALLAWGMLAYLIAIGSLNTFSRTWSLYFLGGRYPLLGQYLEPVVAVPVWTPPPPATPEDGDSGPGLPPDLPMNPAVA